MRISSGKRCCPKCGSTDFEGAACSGGREKLNGYTMYCVDCGWEGFRLQLVPVSDVTTAAQAAKKINEDVIKQRTKTD